MKICLMCLLIFFASVATAVPLQLDTPQGPLVGMPSEMAADIQVFKGIPYALPPVGVLRWTYAQPASNWASPRLAQQFGPNCIQQPYPQNSFFSRPAFTNR